MRKRVTPTLFSAVLHLSRRLAAYTWPMSSLPTIIALGRDHQGLLRAKGGNRADTGTGKKG
jgi:hypothetical protein